MKRILVAALAIACLSFVGCGAKLGKIDKTTTTKPDGTVVVGCKALIAGSNTLGVDASKLSVSGVCGVDANSSTALNAEAAASFFDLGKAIFGPK